MTDYAKYHINNDVVVLTYGQQPCPHAYNRREFEKRVWWTIPRAITVALGGDHQAICVECICEAELKGEQNEQTAISQGSGRECCGAGCSCCKEG